MLEHKVNRWWLRLSVICLVGVTGDLALTQPSLAQNGIVPDATLGGEASQVIPFPLLPNLDLIQGGAVRDSNLFHSFEQFNIAVDGAAYFIAPSLDTTNIFARVTGGDPSQILGILGTIQADFSPSAANLFLMNPNGIVFGPGASLDIGGSFAATTADTIQFGNQGAFSVTDTTTPTLLTVNPSALWFTRLIPQSIINRSIAPAGTSSSGIILTGLSAAPNRSFLLVGGDITMDGGRIVGSGSRIELGGLATPGIVNLETTDKGFSLSIPDQAPRSNITLSNDGLVGLIGRNGGDIVVDTSTLSATLGGRLVAGIEGTEDGGSIAINARDINFSGVGFGGTSSGIISQVAPEASGNAGEINIRTNSLGIRDGAVISSNTFGIGNAGDITISANFVEVLGLSNIADRLSSIDSTSRLASQESVTTGHSGNVSIDTDVLSVGGGARISTEAQSQGQGGNLTIVARESTDLVGSGSLSSSVESSGLSTQTNGAGNAGVLSLETGQLTLQDGAAISASSFGGSGLAGNLDIIADSIRLTGIRSDRQFSSTISSISGVRADFVPATGDAGDISITTRLLTVQDGGSIQTSTVGEGQGGNLTIMASEATNLIGSGTLATRVTSSGLFTQTNGAGNAGRLSLETGQLTLQDGSAIDTSTFGGTGSAGNLDILAESIRLTGIRSDQEFSSAIRSLSGINSNFVPATGNAGDISIITGQLTVQDGGSIQTSTSGEGRGGNLTITARDATNLIGSGTLASGVTSSGLSTETTGSGNAGRLSLVTGQLSLQDGATIGASTFGGSGSAGNLDILADSIRLTGIRSDQQFSSTIRSLSGISPNFVPATGDAGNISVTTRLLTVQDGGSIQTSTFGEGRGGNLTLTASEATSLIGSGNLVSGIVSSGLSTETNGSGNAGRLSLATGQLFLQDGATIGASTFGGSGSAGNLDIIADSIRLTGIRSDQQFSSTIRSISGINPNFVPATGNAGDISVITRLLTVQDGGSIQTSTFGEGQGGNLTLTASEATNLIGSGNLVSGVASSGLSTGTSGSGNAGRLRLATGQLTLQDGATINASTFGGSGTGGDLEIIADSIRLTGIRADQQFSSTIGSTSDLSLDFVPATGNAGNVSITTRLLTVQDGGSIQTSTVGPGLGGNLTITAGESIHLIGSGTLASGVTSSGLGTGTTGSGNAGLLILETGQLILQDGATVTASTFGGSGSAGSLGILADSIHLAGVRSDQQFSSTISSISGISPNFVSATGNAGNVSITTRLLTVQDGGSIQTSTAGEGLGGNLTISATEATNLIGSGSLAAGVVSSRLSTETIGSGNAGRLSLATGQLTLQDGAGIDASTYGGSGSAGSLDILADSIRLAGIRSDQEFSSTIRSISGIRSDFVPATGNAGDISITTRLLTVQDGGSIQTSTFGPGQGGDLTITASESVDLIGTASLSFGPIGSNLFTRTFGAGDAGQLALQAGQLLIRDGAIISTRSDSSGLAGDISLLANRLELIDGTIETDAPFSQGGSIDATVTGNSQTGWIILRGDSDITTNSFGDGGNITLTTLNGIIIAIDDSDILARSDDARGGNITLGPFFSDTLPIGAVSPTENNDRVDVSADGRLAAGTITTPNTSFIQNSLNQLPTVVVDPNTLIAGSCIARTTEGQGSFVATGSGGLPTRPGEGVISAYPTGSVQSLSSVEPQAVWQPGDPIVEPTGAFALPDGRLVLARECSEN